MMYMRGHSADYDGWAVNGAKGWSWTDVMPYFLMSEDNKEIGSVVSQEHHNTGGPMPVRRVRYSGKDIQSSIYIKNENANRVLSLVKKIFKLWSPQPYVNDIWFKY